MSFQFKHNTIIYIYLQLSTLFADTILWLSSFFPHVATIKKKNVRIIFERNNKYNNFIKGLTKALALIHLQIAIHIWELWHNSGKATEHIRELSTKLFYISLAENINYGFVRHKESHNSLQMSKKYIFLAQLFHGSRYIFITEKRIHDMSPSACTPPHTLPKRFVSPVPAATDRTSAAANTAHPHSTGHTLEDTGKQ